MLFDRPSAYCGEIQCRNDVAGKQLNRPQRFAQRQIAERELPDQVGRLRFGELRLQKGGHGLRRPGDALAGVRELVEIPRPLMRRRAPAQLI
jgi:hypothetical protein